MPNATYEQGQHNPDPDRGLNLTELESAFRQARRNLDETLSQCGDSFCGAQFAAMAAEAAREFANAADAMRREQLRNTQN